MKTLRSLTFRRLAFVAVAVSLTLWVGNGLARKTVVHLKPLAADTYAPYAKVVEVLPYDKEIEYLESNGGPKITLDYYPCGNTVVDTRLRIGNGTISETHDIFFAGDYNLPLYRAQLHSDGKNTAPYSLLFYYNRQTTVAYVRWNRSGLDMREAYFRTWRVLHFAASGVTCDGITLSAAVSNPTQSGWLRTASPLDIWRGNITKTPMLIAWFQVRENGVLLHDLIPVRKGDEGYMFDRVSGKLYGNSGTGAFVLGPDK